MRSVVSMTIGLTQLIHSRGTKIVKRKVRERRLIKYVTMCPLTEDSSQINSTEAVPDLPGNFNVAIWSALLRRLTRIGEFCQTYFRIYYARGLRYLIGRMVIFIVVTF